MYISDRIGIPSPTRIARDHTSITKNLFYYRDMTHTISSLYPRLKIDNGSNAGYAGDMPAILVGPSCPLPCIGLCSPRDICAMQLIVALIGPPRTGGIREPVVSTVRRRSCRRRTMGRRS